MARITVEDCLDRIPNRFSLVMIVAKRAKELIRGAQPTVKRSKENKLVVSALREVSQGHVRFGREMTADDVLRDMEKDLKR